MLWVTVGTLLRNYFSIIRYPSSKSGWNRVREQCRGVGGERLPFPVLKICGNIYFRNTPVACVPVGILKKLRRPHAASPGQDAVRIQLRARPARQGGAPLSSVGFFLLVPPNLCFASSVDIL